MDYEEIRHRLVTQVHQLDGLWNNHYGSLDVDQKVEMVGTAIEALKALANLPEVRVELLKPEKGYPKGQQPTLTVVDEISRSDFSPEREAMADLYKEVLDTYHEIFNYYGDEFHVDDKDAELYREDMNTVFGIMFKYGARDK